MPRFEQHVYPNFPAKGIKVDTRPMWKQYYSKFMMAWAVLAHSWLVIQAVEIYDSQDATGVSMLGYIIYMVSAVIWITYGAFVLEERNYVIMTSSSIALTLGMVVTIGVIKYGDSDTQDVGARKQYVTFSNRFERSNSYDGCASCSQNEIAG